MMSGSPPTERNARTGLFTPPTSIFSARSKISRERRRSTLDFVGVALMRSPPKPSRLEPSRGILGVIRQNNVCARALNSRQYFQHDPLLVQPALVRGRFDHRILSTYVVGTCGNVKRGAPTPDDVKIRQCRLH